MILSCHNISKSFDGKKILHGVSFHIEPNEKTAIIGINGAGKTTLLRMITGELEPDTGSVVFARDISFGYVRQNQDLDSDKTIFETLKDAKKEIIALEEDIRFAEESMKTLAGDELLALTDRYTQMTNEFARQGGYSWKGAIIGVAKGLGFTEEDFEKKTGLLSGGERTRVAIGKLLLTHPDIILLDEPTNHLDIKSVQWLETYLRNYQGAVIVVSHDRYFLDKIVGKVIEIENAVSHVYVGNYSVYAEQKAKDREAALHAYINQQREIKRQEEVIKKLKSFNREKSIKRAESREKMLDKVERLEKPANVRDDMRITLKPNVESGTDVLQVEDLSMSFGERTLFKEVSFTVRRGEKIAIVGDNGTGKSTLMKILTGSIIQDVGRVRVGIKVHIGYYDQEQQLLHENKTLFEEISDENPTLSNTQIRTILAAFLFFGDDVYKRVKELSGGEKGKLCLAKLMLSDANFLLLDEPTNHLDITSREVLENAVVNYEGTVLYVSHDRYFINKTATRILDLTNGMLVNYIGDYDYYIEHRPERMNFLLHGSYQSPNEKEPLAGTSRSGIGADFARAAGAAGISTVKKQGFPAMQDRSGGSKELLSDRREADAVTSALSDWKAQKELAAMKRKQESAIKKCEELIDSLERRNEEINEQFSLAEVSSNATKLKVLTDEQKRIELQLNDLYRQWEEMC